MLHPWLATAALGRGSSAGVFTVFSSDYYTAAKEGSVVTCICDTYGGWCAIADRVFEPYTGRYTWEVELVAVGAQKSGLFIAGACIFLLRGFWLCGVQQEVGHSCERSSSFVLYALGVCEIDTSTTPEQLESCAAHGKSGGKKKLRYVSRGYIYIYILVFGYHRLLFLN